MGARVHGHGHELCVASQQNLEQLKHGHKLTKGEYGASAQIVAEHSREVRADYV